MTSTTETIDKAKCAFILKQLLLMTQGPAEAYGTLCLAIHILNFEMSDTPISIDQLADEVAQSLRSIKPHGVQ